MCEEGLGWLAAGLEGAERRQLATRPEEEVKGESGSERERETRGDD